MNWYVEAWKKFTVFQGRSRRKEYWFFALFNMLITIALAIVDMTVGIVNYQAGIGLLSGLFLLTTVIPSLAVGVRRLHDIGRSGWWILIGLVPFVGGIVLLVFALLDSEPGTNQYGPNPKGIAAPAATAAA